jgi:hypothetical protein
MLLTACTDKGDPYEEFIVPSPAATKVPQSGDNQAMDEAEQSGDNQAMDEAKQSGDNQAKDEARQNEAYQPAWIDADAEDMPYQYANMFKSAFGSFVLDTEDKLLFIGEVPGKLTLMEYIKATGRIEPFCKLATCTHQIDECAAGNAAGNLDMRGGRLSMLRGRINNAKSGDMWISELNGNRFDFVTGPVNGYVRGDDAYYVITPDMSLVRIKSGTDKPEILVEEFNAIKPVIINSWLYAADSANIVRMNINGPDYDIETVVGDIVGYSYSTDGSRLYYLHMEDNEPALYRCELDGRNPELVLKALVYPTYLSYDDTYIYYSTTDADNPKDPTNGNIYRFRMDLSGEPELLCETDALYPAVYVLPTSPDTLLVDKDRSYYFLPKAGGELTELQLP